MKTACTSHLALTCKLQHKPAVGSWLDLDATVDVASIAAQGASLPCTWQVMLTGCTCEPAGTQYCLELHCQHNKAHEKGKGKQPPPTGMEPVVSLDKWCRKGFAAVLAAYTGIGRRKLACLVVPAYCCSSLVAS